jgi:hypothetical protein
MELKKHMPAAFASVIHRASISTYSTYKGNKVKRLKLSPRDEAQINGFISIEDFWRVVSGKVQPSEVEGLMRQRGVF